MTTSTDAFNNADLQDDHEDQSVNPTNNRLFADVLEGHMSRRNILRGSIAGATAGFLASPAAASNGFRRFGNKRRGELVGFEPVSIEQATADQTMPSISSDYEYQVLIPWGTPIEPGATEEFTGDPQNRPTSKQAQHQVGIGHDGMFFFPRRRASRRFGHDAYLSSLDGMLCVNHEFGTNPHVLGKQAPVSLEDVRVSQAVHGVSVVAIRNDHYEWRVVKSQNSRRITANTPMAFSGPAADSPLLQNPAGNVPLGTINNCGAGETPWGTYLTCEENFNGYFGDSSIDGPIAPTRAEAGGIPARSENARGDDRYGFSARGFSYGWYAFDKRFDLASEDYVHERNRFGWVVEIDPYDGTQKPVKRTALGRFKHEAIAIGVSKSGRIAAYMGDDQRFDYCYKYVSDKPWRRAISNGESPLDEGKLYAARFNEDGTGEWLELTINNPILAQLFNDQAEVLIYAREAADALGATPMDRPEWTTVGKDGSIFWTLTNNSRRTDTNAANPEAPNQDGHIIKMADGDDFLGEAFTWEIFILASTTRGTDGVFTDPDAAFVDKDGRLFIGTDGSQPDGLQDQLVVFDTSKNPPEPKRLLTGVIDDEVTGFTMTPDRRTAFTNLQHPGNGNPASTSFPKRFDGQTIPRDATLVITRKNFGIIGS